MTLWGSVGWPPMGFEILPLPGYGWRLVTQLLPDPVVLLHEGGRGRGDMRCRAPAPWGGQGQVHRGQTHRYHQCKYSPCTPGCFARHIFIGARGGGCSAPPQAGRGTSANRTRRVHGSTPGPGEEEEDVPSKQATPERKINKQAASSAAPAEGEREPRAGAGGGAGGGAD